MVVYCTCEVTFLECKYIQQAQQYVPWIPFTFWKTNNSCHVFLFPASGQTSSIKDKIQKGDKCCQRFTKHQFTSFGSPPAPQSVVNVWIFSVCATLNDFHVFYYRSHLAYSRITQPVFQQCLGYQDPWVSVNIWCGFIHYLTWHRSIFWNLDNYRMCGTYK